MPKPDIAAIRAQFPALVSGFPYLENAGGSQVPACVVDAVRDYMLNSYVQLGAPYDISRKSTQVVTDAHRFIELYMNAGDGRVVLGPSTTQLVTMLAECYSRRLELGDEIIICETAHEANAGPWEKLRRFGFEIKTWRIDPQTLQCSLDDLKALLTPLTRLVAFPQVSNLLGEVVDVRAITEVVHAAGAKVVVDGVAYAPHRAIDVQVWGVDWYVYSTYKVFGPHMAALYGSKAAFAELEGPNHFFLPDDAYKFELGGANHEGCAGLLALGDYLKFAAGRETLDRETVVAAWDHLGPLELPLQARILEFLNSKPGVNVWGPTTAGPERVATISFTSDRLSPAQICEATDQAGIGIRFGHMYAYRLCKAVGIATEEGVVRVSCAHYNTLDEVERLIEVLDPLI